LCHHRGCSAVYRNRSLAIDMSYDQRRADPGVLSWFWARSRRGLGNFEEYIVGSARGQFLRTFSNRFKRRLGSWERAGREFSGCVSGQCAKI
jgi:hypothetical protein